MTVTGIRGALESAVNIKRESDNIVEVISAEDLGKLPDTSVAEGLSRLPGITALRPQPPRHPRGALLQRHAFAGLVSLDDRLYGE
ncbi:MAG: hypothetical protein RIQ49_2687 [Pseudomonadota bacterium]